jgi:hypothetical protein
MLIKNDNPFLKCGWSWKNSSRNGTYELYSSEISKKIEQAYQYFLFNSEHTSIQITIKDTNYLVDVKQCQQCNMSTPTLAFVLQVVVLHQVQCFISQDPLDSTRGSPCRAMFAANFILKSKVSFSLPALERRNTIGAGPTAPKRQPPPIYPKPVASHQPAAAAAELTSSHVPQNTPVLTAKTPGTATLVLHIDDDPDSQSSNISASTGLDLPVLNESSLIPGQDPTSSNASSSVRSLRDQPSTTLAQPCATFTRPSTAIIQPSKTFFRPRLVRSESTPLVAQSYVSSSDSKPPFTSIQPLESSTLHEETGNDDSDFQELLPRLRSHGVDDNTIKKIELHKLSRLLTSELTVQDGAHLEIDGVNCFRINRAIASANATG